MNKDQSVEAQHTFKLPSPDNWDNVQVTDLFLATPMALARVELVDDPGAMLQIGSDSLLTELLCEV